MEIIGKISHYASQGNVVFSFQQIDPKKDTGLNDVVAYDLNIPFEIYKKFKDRVVKITVEKAPE
jgi:hypothetical protein